MLTLFDDKNAYFYIYLLFTKKKNIDKIIY